MENTVINTPSETGELDSKQRPLFLTQKPLLYNLAGLDLGLGNTMRAFLRRVGLSTGQWSGVEHGAVEREMPSLPRGKSRARLERRRLWQLCSRCQIINPVRPGRPGGMLYVYVYTEGVSHSPHMRTSFVISPGTTCRQKVSAKCGLL